MCTQSCAEDDPVTSVPTAIGTRAVKKHLRSQTDSSECEFRPATSSLLQRQKRKSSRDNPTHGARKPRPSIFIGIKLHVTINRPELPIPWPLAFAAATIQEPTEGIVKVSSRDANEDQSDQCQRGRPASFRVVTFECRPRSIRMLRA